MIEDETLLLAVLNSAPVTRGQVSDVLLGPDGVALAKRFGGTGSSLELKHLRDARRSLHRIIRSGEQDEQGGAGPLGALMNSVTLRPDVSSGGIRWVLAAPPDLLLAARVVLAWSRAGEELPGRLRPCANADCNLYLIDHSRPGTARWCSMSTCGNRSKVRAHAQRTRPASAEP